MKRYLADSEKIYKLFTETELSNQQIAEQTNVSRMSIYNLRKGRTKWGSMKLELASDLTHLYDKYIKERQHRTIDN